VIRIRFDMRFFRIMPQQRRMNVLKSPSRTNRRRQYRHILCGICLIASFAATSAAQQPNPPAQANPPAQTETPVQANPPQQPIPPGATVIKDKAEYDAFMAASSIQDPASRAEAMETFAQHYPKSVVMVDALDEALSAWQSAGDSVKMLEVAKELQAADPANVRALAIVVALDRVSAAQGDTTALDDLCLQSTGGMRLITMWQKPANMADADFAQLRKQMEIIFNGAAGYCALRERNYSQARDWLTRSFQMNPGDLEDLYDLAIADLEMTPPDTNGFWYCAKAVQLAKSANTTDTTSGVANYCEHRYKAYHGGDDGWDAILTASTTQAAVPNDFAKGIKAAPAPPPPPADTNQK
jgi:hypothetical protein